MKEKMRFTFFILLGAMLLLNGCFYCGDYEEKEDLVAYTFSETSIALMDSLKNEYVAKNKWSTSEVEKTKPSKGYDDNKFVYDMYWYNNSSDHKGVKGIVLRFNLYACTPDNDCDYNFVMADTVSRLIIELHGCDNFTCKNTSRIVVHDRDYRYVRAFDKSQFSITDGGDFEYSTDGDCTVYKKLSFNLVINGEDIKINWNIKDGYIDCTSTKCHRVTDYSVWG